MSYKVVAPLVLAKDPEGRVHERYAEAIIQWLSPEQEKHFLGLGLVVKLGAQPQAAPDNADDDSGDTDDDSGVPKKTATKAVWVAYAVEQTAGTDSPLTEEEADALTKAELVERFG